MGSHHWLGPEHSLGLTSDHTPGQETSLADSPARGAAPAEDVPGPSESAAFEGTTRGAATRGAGFRAVLADGEFRALWLARVLSSAGDQISRVALSVLVYNRTGSATYTALSYAMTMLPWIIGGPLLSGLADRWPRKSVMLSADLARAGLVIAAALCAVRALPLVLPIALIFAAELCSPPFEAARGALIPVILDDDRYVVASALGSVTEQASQVLGFALGGGLVAVFGARNGLALNGFSFALSAALIALAVRPRPSATAAPQATAARPGPGWWGDLVAGTRLIVFDPFLRTLVLLAMLVVFLIVPEGLAAPVARADGGGDVAVGLLLASIPLGSAIGGLVIARLVRPDHRVRAIAPLAIGAGLPLLACAAHPGLVITLLLWTATGLLLAYQLPANTAFALAVPDRHRGQAFGVVQTAMAAGQGLGLFGAGLLADRFAPLHVIAAAGAVTCAFAVLIVLLGPRSGERSEPSSAPAPTAH